MSEEISRASSEARCPKQRDFVRFVLRRQWTSIFRVKVPAENRKAIDIKWCRDMLHGRWSKSDFNEVFYFEDVQDATMFRLRWIGAIPENSVLTGE